MGHASIHRYPNTFCHGVKCTTCDASASARSTGGSEGAPGPTENGRCQRGFGGLVERAPGRTENGRPGRWLGGARSISLMAIRAAVFGSLNHDIAVTVPHMPASDETLRAIGMAEFCGGKGFNQSVACARLGATTDMIGRVGRDGAGELLTGALDRNHVGHRHVVLDDEHTGTALITTDQHDVTIVIVSGANGSVSVADADAAHDVLMSCNVLLLQGEVSHQAAAHAAQIVRAAGGIVVFSPAPVHADSALVLPHASFVVANQGEAAALALRPTRTTVITQGKDGALIGDVVVPIFPATVVDPTGAGDAFTAAFAVAVAEGADPVEAARFGCAAGSWAVRIAGAEPSMPTRAQVESVLAGG
jgi:ribokinase